MGVGHTVMAGKFLKDQFALRVVLSAVFLKVVMYASVNIFDFSKGFNSKAKCALFALFLNLKTIKLMFSGVSTE